MLNQTNYNGFWEKDPKCGEPNIGLFVCDRSAYEFVPFDPERSNPGNDNLSQMRRPKTTRAIQLGFHDCLKYKEGTTDGAVDGCDGCLNWDGVGFEFKETWFNGNPNDESTVNHFTRSYPISHETTNNGLEGTARALEKIYTNLTWPTSAPSVNVSLKDSGKSRADLWAFAAQVSLEMEIVRANYACDADVERQQTGIHEGRDKCDIKLHRPIKFKYGRKDCIPEPGQPTPYITSKQEKHDNPWGHGDHVISNLYHDFGLTAEESIALLAAHGVQSRVHNKLLATKYAWVGTPYLSNTFFRRWAAKPVYGFDTGVDGFINMNIVLAGDKRGRPVDNYGYRLSCTGMWNITDGTGDDGPCYFKRQQNLIKNPVHRASSSRSRERYGPKYATDGIISDYDWHWFSSQTQDNPWIELRLVSTTMVSSVAITMPVKYGGSEFKNVQIRAGMEKIETDPKEVLNINTLCGIFEGPGGQLTTHMIECSEPIQADFVIIQIMGENAYLNINEITVNNKSATEVFLQEKTDDEYLRPMCFDTRRKANNPNLDGEITKIPQEYVDENGEQIGGNNWWSIDAPADCCDNATYVDIPGIDHYKIQVGGCKQVLYPGKDTFNFMSIFEMSMYMNFTVNKNNRPLGCRGLEPLTLADNKIEFSMIGEEDIQCDKNMKNDFSSNEKAYSQIIEEFAEDHDGWAVHFLDGWDKMIQNGYGSGQLVDGPQSTWLGYDSWTKGNVLCFSIRGYSFHVIAVNTDTDDFEEYIVKNSPAIVTNNTAENPTVISSALQTFKEECENKSGMGGNRNYNRCPADLLDL